MSPAEAVRALANWLDGQGRLRAWPTKRRLQRAAVHYLVAKFERGRQYAEPEVNAVLDEWASFRDAPLLRRTLIEEHMLGRTPDGSRYWVATEEVRPSPVP